MSAINKKVISCQGDSVVINESISPRGGYCDQLVIGHDEINQILLSTSISNLSPYDEYIASSFGFQRFDCFEEIPFKEYHDWYQHKWCMSDSRNLKNIWIGYNEENNALFIEFYHMNSHNRSTEIYIENCYLVNSQY